MGEVRNDTHLDVSNAAVPAVFHGKDGHKRGHVTDQMIPLVLPADAWSPFVIILEQPPETATHSLRATGRVS